MKPRTTRLIDLNLQQLQTFLIVYEQLSYAAAARIIGLSVPTIWEQVRSLEAVYGTVLFRKVGRRIEATAAAHRLNSELEPILNSLQSTVDIVSDADGPGQGKITLVTGVRMMLEDLAQPLSQFRNAFPGINLRIRQGNDVSAEELVLSGDADCAFTLEPTYEHQSPRLEYRPVYAIDIVAVFPPGHALDAIEEISLEDLAEHPLVIGGPRTHVRQTLEEELHRKDLKANIVVETDTGAFTIACVQEGMGVGLLAGNPDGVLCRGLTVRSLRNQLGVRRIVVFWKKGRRLTAPLQSLIDTVAAVGERD